MEGPVQNTTDYVTITEIECLQGILDPYSKDLR